MTWAASRLPVARERSKGTGTKKAEGGQSFFSETTTDYIITIVLLCAIARLPSLCISLCLVYLTTSLDAASRHDDPMSTCMCSLQQQQQFGLVLLNV